MTGQIRVVLADDHQVYRNGLMRSLTDDTGIDVVGVAGEEDMLKLATIGKSNRNRVEAA